MKTAFRTISPVSTVVTPIVHVLNLPVGRNLAVKFTGTNTLNNLPEFSTNLTTPNWFALTVQTNFAVNGTNHINLWSGDRRECGFHPCSGSMTPGKLSPAHDRLRSATPAAPGPARRPQNRRNARFDHSDTIIISRRPICPPRR